MTCSSMKEVEHRWSTIEPIIPGEVTAPLRGMGATGMDKISAKDLLRLHQPSLAGYFNLIMAVVALPAILSGARVPLYIRWTILKILGNLDQSL